MKQLILLTFLFSIASPSFSQQAEWEESLVLIPYHLSRLATLLESPEYSIIDGTNEKDIIDVLDDICSLNIAVLETLPSKQQAIEASKIDGFQKITYDKDYEGLPLYMAIAIRELQFRLLQAIQSTLASSNNVSAIQLVYSEKNQIIEYTLSKLEELSDENLRNRYWRGLYRMLNDTRLRESIGEIMTVGDMIESIGFDKPTLDSSVNELLIGESNISNIEIAEAILKGLIPENDGAIVTATEVNTVTYDPLPPITNIRRETEFAKLKEGGCRFLYKFVSAESGYFIRVKLVIGAWKVQSFFIDSGEAIRFQLENGEHIKLINREKKSTGYGDGAIGLTASQAPGMDIFFKVEADDIDTLSKQRIQKFFIYTSEGVVEKSVSGGNSSEFKEAINYIIAQ